MNQVKDYENILKKEVHPGETIFDSLNKIDWPSEWDKIFKDASGENASLTISSPPKTHHVKTPEKSVDEIKKEANEFKLSEEILSQFDLEYSFGDELLNSSYTGYYNESDFPNEDIPSNSESPDTEKNHNSGPSGIEAPVTKDDHSMSQFDLPSTSSGRKRNYKQNDTKIYNWNPKDIERQVLKDHKNSMPEFALPSTSSGKTSSYKPLKTFKTQKRNRPLKTQKMEANEFKIKEEILSPFDLEYSFGDELLNSSYSGYYNESDFPNEDIPSNTESPVTENNQNSGPRGIEAPVIKDDHSIPQITLPSTLSGRKISYKQKDLKNHSWNPKDIERQVLKDNHNPKDFALPSTSTAKTSYKPLKAYKTQKRNLPLKAQKMEANEFKLKEDILSQFDFKYFFGDELLDSSYTGYYNESDFPNEDIPSNTESPGTENNHNSGPRGFEAPITKDNHIKMPQIALPSTSSGRKRSYKQKDIKIHNNNNDIETQIPKDNHTSMKEFSLPSTSSGKTSRNKPLKTYKTQKRNRPLKAQKEVPRCMYSLLGQLRFPKLNNGPKVKGPTKGDPPHAEFVSLLELYEGLSATAPSDSMLNAKNLVILEEEKLISEWNKNSKRQIMDLINYRRKALISGYSYLENPPDYQKAQNPIFEANPDICQALFLWNRAFGRFTFNPPNNKHKLFLPLPLCKAHKGMLFYLRRSVKKGQRKQYFIRCWLCFKLLRICLEPWKGYVVCGSCKKIKNARIN